MSWNYYWPITNVFTTGPDRPAEPVGPGVGVVGGPAKVLEPFYIEPAGWFGDRRSDQMAGGYKVRPELVEREERDGRNHHNFTGS
ncbi:hypothetical protein Hanom_Chr02g00161871 [Helianthus anomalus]